MVRKKARVVEQTIQVSYTYTRRIALVEKRCLVCEKRFAGIKKRKYCSRACQNKAFYERHADEYRHARRERYHAEKTATAGKK